MVGMTIRSMLSGGVITAVCTSAPAPTPEPPSKPHAERGGPQHEVEYTYKGPADDAGDDAAAEPPVSSDDGGTEVAASTVADPAELEARVRAAAIAVLPEHAALLLSPPLPIGWPAAPGKVLYVVYPLDPLESGETRWRVGKALATVTVTLEPEALDVATITPGKKDKALGTLVRGRTRVDDPVHPANSALFEIVSGKRDADKTRYMFRRYDEWIDRHPVLRGDLRARAAAFFAWTDG